VESCERGVRCAFLLVSEKGRRATQRLTVSLCSLQDAGTALLVRCVPVSKGAQLIIVHLHGRNPRQRCLLLLQGLESIRLQANSCPTSNLLWRPSGPVEQSKNDGNYGEPGG